MRQPLFDFDPRFMAWLGTLPPRQELAVRLAMRGRHGNLRQDRAWTARVDELKARLKIDTAAKLGALLAEAETLGAAIDAQQGRVLS